MEFAIFSKTKQTREGKKFVVYISRFTKKSGEVVPVSVRFRESCGAPKPEECPMNIKVLKEHANMVTSDYVREDTGEVGTSYKLWVSAWEPGAPYVDKSLDDFEV